MEDNHAGQLTESLPERFEKVAQNYPNRIAVKTQSNVITYDVLNRTANRISRAVLERLGFDSEPVALLFGNGIDLIASVIGVLKAEKFFVAIDPSFPSSRIMYIMRNTETRLVLTNHANRDFARTLIGNDGRCLNIDEIDGQIDDANLNLPITPNHIATVVFTSGSTGEPKGVVKTHGYSLERAEFNIRFLAVKVQDRLSLLHSISFGSGEINLYASLLSGATLLPFDAKELGSQLAQWLAEEKITILHCPPSLFRQLVECLPVDLALSNLRLIHLSGSPINRSDFELYRGHFPLTTSLTFHMGATEAGCIACAVVDHSFPFPEKGTPAGFTREEKKVLILDDDRQELKPGEIGEIAVKSRHLAQGYWKDPDLTLSKFLQAENGERMYLTGDMGRLRPDGFFDSLGP
jgi:non-ribosomal peptide synthetase component F